MWICSYVNCPKSKPDTFGMNNRTCLAHAGLLPAKRWGAVARTLLCHFLKNLKLITSTHCANKILQNCSFKERSLKHTGHLKHDIIRRKNARLMWYSWCIAFSKWSFKLVIIVLLFTGLWENSASTTAATVWQRANPRLPSRKRNVKCWCVWVEWQILWNIWATKCWHLMVEVCITTLEKFQ